MRQAPNKKHVVSIDRQAPKNIARTPKAYKTQSIADAKPAKKAGPVSPEEIIPMGEKDFVDF